MKRIAIIGGGISGLAAAFYLERLRREGAQVEYVLFEASSRLGGVIRTDRVNDCVIEAGPDSFLTAKPWAAELARDAGIGDQLLPSNDRKRKTFILDRGNLVPLPEGLQMMVPTRIWPMLVTPLLSFNTKLKMLAELMAPPPPLAAGTDESVSSFVARHFGSEVVEKLAQPLLAGIYGGDPGQLSARASLPRLVALESGHRSLVRGTLRSLAAREGSEPASLFTSFRGGMQQLVDAVAAKIDSRFFRLNAEVTSLSPVDHGWTVSTSGTEERFDQVIVAAPSYIASRLLTFDPALSSLLAGISYNSTVTVALGYSCDKLRRCTTLPSGFGFLVPAREGKKIIACTFVHNKFDSRVGDDSVLFRAFMTGSPQKSEAELIASVESEVASILKIKAPTECARAYRWDRAMPQYAVGHLDTVAKIEAGTSRHKGLQLIGNAYRGLGIPDCVREGKLAAERVLS